MNRSRRCTETVLELEECDIESMGLINDAKTMMDSLVGWQEGMTLQGRMSITQNLESASGNVRTVLAELESWLGEGCATRG